MVYSLDLRKKALSYIENGASLTETSRIFGVTTRTLSNWLQRQKQQDLAPKMHGSSPSKIDNDKLRKYIEDHPDSCLREIAKVFSTTLQAIFYACKRLKITLKKRSPSIRKEMKKKVPRRTRKNS
jgi:transposase